MKAAREKAFLRGGYRLLLRADRTSERELTSFVSLMETDDSKEEEDADGSHAHWPGMTVRHVLRTKLEVRRGESQRFEVFRRRSGVC